MIATKKNKPLYLLFDGDMLVFEAAASCETTVNWYGDVWTVHSNASDTQAMVEDRIADITSKVLTKLNIDTKYEIIICFSDPEKNFRKEILTSYKGTRSGKLKPTSYGATRTWIEERYNCCCYPTLEADDCVGLLANKYKGHEVHISGDKDFKTIAGIFYNHLQGEMHIITEEEAYRNFLVQTLAGDTADNYKGCPRIGVKSANKAFDSYGVSWETVVWLFKHAGLTEEDALTQARVAYILQKKGDYDIKSHKVRLWKPSKKN